VFGLFNRQGGPRGDTELVMPNWWMGMATRNAGRHRVTFNGMLSLDPATVGKSGYAEIFQVGEVLAGEPLVDRQHPHDFLMQLAAAWRMSFGEGRSLTLSGGPAGEPTLGPVAFMHRASASGLPLAPLGHHTFDSTHLSFGVAAASLAIGRVTIEGSLFNGREPDEDRWDFDLARLDSVSGRVWIRPASNWAVQVSTGRLREPEALEPGDIRRTTTSISWDAVRPDGFTAVTAGWGMNEAHETRRHGLFIEGSTERGASSAFARAERQQLEIAKLIGHHGDDEHHDDRSAVTALTMGAARRLIAVRGWDGAIGAQVTVYRVPRTLQPTHGSSPVSAQVFFRLRLPTGGGARMWGQTMGGGH
jgi:hypothetical protein